MKRNLFLLLLIITVQYAYSADKQAQADKFYRMGAEYPVTIKIEMDAAQWNLLKNDDPVNGEYPWRVATKIQVIAGAIGSIPAYTNLKIKKKSTVGSADKTKPCIKIKVNDEGIEDYIGTSHLTLNNSKQDPTFMRQCLSNYICKLAGLPYSRCNHAAVYVNNVYQGVYVNVEPLEKRFIKNNFRKSNGSEGEAKGNLYEAEIGMDFNSGTTLDVKDLSAYTNYLDITRACSYIDANGVNSIKNVIDLNQFNRFWAMEILLKHWDGNTESKNNTYFYNDVTAVSNPVAPNKAQINFKFIPWGTDQVLQSNHSWAFYNRSYLAQNLFSDQPHRWLLYGEMTNILNTCFDPNAYYSIIRPYLNSMATNLSTIRASNPSFTEPHNPTFDPSELKSQCKQAYLTGYQDLLNSKAYPFDGITLPSDRDINTSPVYVDDNVPPNSTLYGTNESWAWVSSPTYSGTQAHQSAYYAGEHQHYFNDYQNTKQIKIGAELYTYVYLDPINPPSTVMLQWHRNGQYSTVEGGGGWVRAYWGSDLLTSWGPRTYMGPLPKTGTWVRLSVPASVVDCENKTLDGMAFGLYGGKATWDCSGVFNPAINAWIDDKLPTAAVPRGEEPWGWSDNSPYSGTRCHESPTMSGLHQHYFEYTSRLMHVRTGGELFTYVYLNANSMPSEIMLQWHDGNDWKRAYWGADKIDWSPRVRMGDLPPPGKWVKLSVPASSVGLDHKHVQGMAFTLYDGSARWDATGVQ